VNADTKLSDVLPLIDCELTIQEIAERLGISVEAVCALVAAASLSSSLARTLQPPFPFR
jgi:DNA-binding NarL/FixJ family response regulator